MRAAHDPSTGRSEGSIYARSFRRVSVTLSGIDSFLRLEVFRIGRGSFGNPYQRCRFAVDVGGRHPLYERHLGWAETPACLVCGGRRRSRN